MKITCKPSPNGIHTLADGRKMVEMVDLIGSDGSMWGSVHIDFFHAKESDPDRSLYDTLRRGESAVVEIIKGHVE